MKRRSMMLSTFSFISLAGISRAVAGEFPMTDTIIGSAGADKDKADRAGLLLVSRFRNELLSEGIHSTFRVGDIRLFEHTQEPSPLGERIAETARKEGQSRGWCYAGAPWIGQGMISRTGEDAILRARIVHDVTGVTYSLRPLLLVGMGRRASMGPVSSVKSW